MKVTVVIPAYQEQERLPKTLARLRAYFASEPAAQWDVIVADDGSRDATAEVARQAAAGFPVPLRVVSLPENRGKGAAIRQGVLASEGEFVLVSDADLSTPIEEWRKLAASGAPVAIGSRAIDTSLVRERQPLYRVWGGRLVNLAIRALAVPGIHDTQCGFKWFEGNLARRLFAQARIDRFAYDVEILRLARLEGVRIAEVPVLWYNSPDSRVHVVRDTLRLLRDLVRIRLLHRRRTRSKI